MKRCLKCDLIFHLEERSRCLYCDSLLVSLGPEEEPEDFGGFDETASREARAKKQAIINQMIHDRRVRGHGRMQYIVGSYFRTRTFQIMYNFSRNEFRIGKDFSRPLIQPLNTAHFFMIPWVLIDLIDSVVVRCVYSAYCPNCGWKYHKLAGKHEHPDRHCDYCREYLLIIEDILSGRITETERIFKKRSFEIRLAGGRSAYHDLCSQKSFISTISDIMCIWLSMAGMLTGMVLLLNLLFKLLFRDVQLPMLYLR